MGVLYDIGCQLHRSIIKFNLLPDYRQRLHFAISVFHAYGHQCPCQIIYHPCKCVRFGLSDGEGCERFWSSIKHLILTLRVSGVNQLYPPDIDVLIRCGLVMQFNQRLLTLDMQVKHRDEKNLEGLGG